MRDDERPRPLLLAVLLLVLPSALIGVSAAMYLVDLGPGQHLTALWVAHAVLSILIVAVPGALLATKGHRPGLILFALALLPALIGIGVPLVRHQGLASPLWMGDMLVREAYAGMQGGWESVASGAVLSAALTGWYCLAEGLWPTARARGAEVWGPGRERTPLLLAGPAASLLCAISWRLVGLRPLASDLAIWIFACIPALLLAAGSRRARLQRDVLRMMAAFVGCVLLLALAGHARSMSTATTRAPDQSGGLCVSLSASVLRESIQRWFVAGLSAAFGVLALMPGRVRLRRHRRLGWGVVAPWAMATAVPAAGALLPDARMMQALRSAQGAWETLLASRAVQLPRCSSAAVPVSPGPLVLVPARGDALVQGEPNGAPNIAVSGDTPFTAVMEALTGMVPPAVGDAALLVTGCGAANPGASSFGSGLADLRAVPIRTASSVDCGPRGDVQIIVFEAEGARVLRHGCSAASGPPERMPQGEAWRQASDKKVFVSVSGQLTVSRFLALLGEPAGAQAVVVLDAGDLRASLDRAATRFMLVGPGPRGIWKGALVLESVAGSGTPVEHPEALYVPIRSHLALLDCFDAVTREQHIRLGFEVAAGGRVAVSAGEKVDGSEGCVAQSMQSAVLRDARPGAYEATLAWYPAAVSAPEGLVSSGLLQVSAEPESGGMRGADALGARLSPFFARCVGDLLQTDPDVSGSADLTVCVQPGGLLEPSGGESNRIPRSALDCMRDAVRLVRAEPEYVVGSQAACFRAHVRVRNANESRSYSLDITVQEPEREASLKRESGESENAWRAAQASTDVLACFGHPSEAPELLGEIRLTVRPNRSGHVMSVTAETSGVVDPKLTRCAADTLSRTVMHVDPESSPPPRIGITLKVSTKPSP
jgi:hypothetical protein